MLPVNFNLTIASGDVDTFIQLLNEGGFKVQGEAMQIQWDSLNASRACNYDKTTPDEVKRNIEVMKDKSCKTCEHFFMQLTMLPCSACKCFSNYESV